MIASGHFVTIVHSEPAAFDTADHTAHESAPERHTEKVARPESRGALEAVRDHVGPLGLGAITVGTALSVAGVVWAVHLGVVYPIAIMVGYCTAVSTVFLTLGVSLLPKAEPMRVEPPPALAAVSEAWKHVGTFSVSDAARLWCEVEPGATVTQDVIAWARLLLDAIANGELASVRNEAQSGRPRSFAPDKPHWSTEVTREALQTWARSRGFEPSFLQDS